MTKYISIHKGLDRAYNSLLSEDIIKTGIGSLRVVIFSDHHRGVRDGADDFQLCEETYCKALRYYFKNGYTLIILGDAEDLWECRARPVVREYNKTLNLEADFFRDNKDRFHRIYGNHDDYWGETGYIKISGTRIPVRDKMLLRLHDKNNIIIGDIFLVHGHQGYRFRLISKFLVRYLWRPFQRITGIRLTSPAKDSSLRGIHNLSMYNWVFKKNDSQQKLLLIAGHTHHPVFASKDHIGKITDELKILREKYGNAKNSGSPDADDLAVQLANKKTQLEYRKGHERMRGNQNGISMDKPCYFNTGCCSYSDGDITGIELFRNKIKLFKWSPDKPHAEVIEYAYLRKDIFRKL